MLNIQFELVLKIAEISRQAGDDIMAIYATDFAIDTKTDKTPVTEADHIAEKFILEAISQRISNSFPIVSEEDASTGSAAIVGDAPFWLIDPLDGTKEFVSRNGEFTVNIALIDKFQPVLGVVHLPAQKTTYIGFSDGAYRIHRDTNYKNIRCRKPPKDGLTALVSRSHLTPEVNSYLTNFDINTTITAGSSLKFCRIAEGAADIYPRFGRTMEWDTAAGHAVLKFAGGAVQKLDGEELTYGKPGFENPHFVAASLGVI